MVCSKTIVKKILGDTPKKDKYSYNKKKKYSCKK